MRLTRLSTNLELGFEESQNQRDARVEALWAKLDPGRTGALDLEGLRRGLRRIDHPMKNADALLKQILSQVDTNHDGKIQYEEFRVFVEQAERQLLLLFHSIDKDDNGRIDMKELQDAFRGAGLTISNSSLADFFNDMDKNHDGFVSFEEWRNFLLFMPVRKQDSQLGAVLTYYYSVVSVTPEGDSLVTDETLEGLGEQKAASRRTVSHVDSEVSSAQAETLATLTTVATEVAKPGREASAIDDPQQSGDGTLEEPHVDPKVSGRASSTKKESRLTDFAPAPGYFLAGAIAGGVSRTATAPFDRLKVYLLVQTSSSSAVTAAPLTKRGPALVNNALRPLGDAVKDIFRTGGVRGFYVGNGLNVLKIMPETAIKFGSYEAAKRALANFEGHGDPKKISSYSKFIAGGAAGMIAQMQCETVKGGLRGAALVRQTARTMYADGGVRACYRGVTMGLVGMFPYSAIDMGMFELLKKTYQSFYARRLGCHEDDLVLGNVATGIIGATSGAIGATAVYPLNLLRTRLQTQGTAAHRAVYTSVWDVARKTIRQEGLLGLYKGLTPNLLKVAPALSITWVVYENSKRLLGLH